MTSKVMLNERCIPTYGDPVRIGDVFVVNMTFFRKEFAGQGRSVKQAQQEAARQFCEILGLKSWA